MNIDKIREAFEEEFDEMHQLTSEQYMEFTKLYDRRGLNRSLRFYYDDAEEIIYFGMSEDSFRSWEYYLGMEYDKENIQTFIKIDNEVLVGYNTEGRAGSIWEEIKFLMEGGES